jgi:DNA-binding response OmpR family regulator
MKKILIVEDDKYLIQAYKGKFSKSGLEAMYAEDGSEASELIKTYTPDLILLDLIMPLKDGFMLLAELRANPTFQDTPVLVTTNLEQASDRERCMDLGATDYIVKSNMSLDEIVSKVKTILGE